MKPILSKEEFGLNIRVQRTRKRMTQADLSVHCDVKPSHISMIENGLNYPNLVLAIKLAGALDTTLEELILAKQLQVS